jgi:hypothetical protein
LARLLLAADDPLAAKSSLAGARMTKSLARQRIGKVAVK